MLPGYNKNPPLLQHDDKNVEDLDTDGEDHAADETRYACTSFPWTVDARKEEKINFADAQAYPTINQLLSKARAKRLELASR